jgi:uncharacterized protein YbjT (DUF2867 family)
VACDLLKGEGIEAALDGMETILHLAGSLKGDDEATRNLVRAASKAGVRHLVYISVIGADRFPLGWYRSKLRAERVVADSGLPWTTLRAAQFDDLVLTLAQKMAKMPVIPVPSAIRLQPVDASEVAARLMELTLDKPAGLLPDLAGPRVYGLAELIRDYLRARGSRRPIVPVPMPGKVGRAYRAGENLALEGAVVGKLTWEDFLAERVGT